MISSNGGADSAAVLSPAEKKPLEARPPWVPHEKTRRAHGPADKGRPAVPQWRRAAFPTERSAEPRVFFFFFSGLPERTGFSKRNVPSRESPFME